MHFALAHVALAMVCGVGVWLHSVRAPRKNPLISIECNKVVDNRFISVLLRYIFLVLSSVFFFGPRDRDTFSLGHLVPGISSASRYLCIECNRKDHFSSVYLMQIGRSALCALPPSHCFVQTHECKSIWYSVCTFLRIYYSIQRFPHSISTGGIHRLDSSLFSPDSKSPKASGLNNENTMRLMHWDENYYGSSNLGRP